MDVDTGIAESSSRGVVNEDNVCRFVVVNSIPLEHGRAVLLKKAPREVRACCWRRVHPDTKGIEGSCAQVECGGY